MISDESEEFHVPNFVGFFPERVYQMLTLALESGIWNINTALMYQSHKQVFYVLANTFAF